MIVLVSSIISLIVGALISVLQLWFPETKKTKKILSFIFLISVIFGVVTLVVDKNEKDEIEDTIKSTPKKIDTLKTIVDEQTNSLSLSLQKNQILLDSLSELDGKTRKILKLNKDLVNQFEDVNSSLQNQIALGKNLGKELEKQKYKLPEKLFLTLELFFRLNKKIDYSAYLEAPENAQLENIHFMDNYPFTKYYQKEWNESVETLGLLSVNGRIKLKGSSIFKLFSTYPIKYRLDITPNWDNLTDYYKTKESKDIYGKLIYDAPDDYYELEVLKFPVNFYKNNNVTSIMDLNGLDIQIDLAFLSSNSKYSTNYIKLINVLNAHKIFIRSENSIVAELQNIKILKNTNYQNVISAKVKVLKEKNK